MHKLSLWLHALIGYLNGQKGRRTGTVLHTSLRCYKRGERIPLYFWMIVQYELINVFPLISLEDAGKEKRAERKPAPLPLRVFTEPWFHRI